VWSSGPSPSPNAAQRRDLTETPASTKPEVLVPQFYHYFKRWHADFADLSLPVPKASLWDEQRAK
jgi:hypothetical protein